MYVIHCVYICYILTYQIYIMDVKYITHKYMYLYIICVYTYIYTYTLTAENIEHRLSELEMSLEPRKPELEGLENTEW